MRFPFALTFAALLASVRAGLEDCQHSKALNSKNFDSHIQAASSGALVAFYAPWCGHCKSLAPAWDTVAADFANEEGCLVAHVDADNAENKALASKFGVTGYPTLKFFPGPGKSPIDYQSGRSADAIRAYLNDKCKTDRQPGGGLGANAGRIPSLDELAAKFIGTPTEERPALLASASALAQSLSDTSAQYYVKVFSKLSESTGYVDQELQRLAKMASKKGTIAGSKLDELQLRQNVLNAFNVVAASASSVTDAAAKTASSIIGEATKVDVPKIVEQMAGDAQASAESAASVVGGQAAGATASVTSAASEATEAVKSAMGRAGAEL